MSDTKNDLNNDLKIDNESHIYLDEFVQKLSEIESLILNVSNDGKPDFLKKISRWVHSLKGSAGSYGFDLLSIACHKMEDQIAVGEFQDHDKLVDDLLKTKDIMLSLCGSYKIRDLPSLEIYRRHFGISHATSQTPYLTVFANSPETKLPFTVQQKVRVLVCESSKLINRKFIQTLSGFDVEVSTSKDGYEALGRLLKEHFDVLLTSLRVPLIDAIGLLKILEQVPNSNKDIKSVVVTSHKSLLAKTHRMDLNVIEKGPSLDEDLKKLLGKMLPSKKSDKIDVFTGKYKILLVDDSQDIHRLVEVTLKKLTNVELVHCQDARQAEMMIMNEKPNLVLLDIQMPNISGEELFIRVQLHNLLKDMQIIFLTGLDSEEDLKRLSALGATGIIRKPFAPQILVNYVHKLLGVKAG